MLTQICACRDDHSRHPTAEMHPSLPHSAASPLGTDPPNSGVLGQPSLGAYSSRTGVVFPIAAASGGLQRREFPISVLQLVRSQLVLSALR